MCNISNGYELRPGSNEDIMEMVRARAQWRKERAEMHSLWCTALYRLSIANHVRSPAAENFPK